MSKPHLVVLSGAGVSAESGIQTFRDIDGLWMGHNIEDVATPRAFKKNPALVLEFYNQRRRDIANASPNIAHVSIASLENHFKVSVITQNVDDLHERAGSTNVLHLHGEIFKMRSEKNEALIYQIRTDINLGDKADDGAQLRPHIVWFEESVPFIEDAAAICASADYFLVIGTSLQVYPAAGLVHYVPDHCLTYVIDKKIPSIQNKSKITFIETNATEGMEHLYDLLLQQLKS